MFAVVELIGVCIGLAVIILGIYRMANSEKIKKRYVVYIIVGLIFAVSSIVALMVTYYICLKLMTGIASF